MGKYLNSYLLSPFASTSNIQMDRILVVILFTLTVYIYLIINHFPANVTVITKNAV